MNNAKQIFFFMIGPFFARLLSFLSLPIISYFVSIEDFGIYTLFTMLLMYFVPLVTLSTDQYFLRTYTKENGIKLRKNLSIMYSMIFMLLLLGLLIFFNIYQSILFEQKFLYITALIVAFFNSLQELYTRTLRAENMGEYYSLVIVVSQVSGLIFTIVFVIITKDIIGLVVGQFAAAFVNLIFNIFIYRKKLKNQEKESRENENISTKPLDIGILKASLTFSLPLLPGVFLWVVQSTIGRLFVLKFLTDYDLGIYGVGIRFATITNLFVTSFLVFWEPKLYQFFDKYEDTIDFKQASQKYKNIYSLMIELIIVMLFIFNPLLIQILSSSYQNALYIIPLMIFQNYIHGYNYFCGYGPQLTGKTKKTILPFVISVIVNFLFNLIFIKKLGIISVLIGSNLGFMTLLLLNYSISNKLVKNNIRLGSEIIRIVCYNLIAVFYYYSKSYFFSLILFLIIFSFNIFNSRAHLKLYYLEIKNMLKEKFKKQKI